MSANKAAFTARHCGADLRIVLLPLVFVVIEVRVVSRGLDLRHERRRQLLRFELFEVEPSEPRMGFHVFRAVLESAQPARGVDGEETVNEVLGHRLQQIAVARRLSGGGRLRLACLHKQTCRCGGQGTRHLMIFR